MGWPGGNAAPNADSVPPSGRLIPCHQASARFRWYRVPKQPAKPVLRPNPAPSQARQGTRYTVSGTTNGLRYARVNSALALSLSMNFSAWASNRSFTPSW